ncbi:hypothetical protein [Nocardia sp. alder85J]|uniref:hypothetical protein n=1 Tax=Nocardia sp. alder85J TaxID=2862949 RepID=UPI001CD19696|nr:hypothetical protein [Nocardia sp. alder85J]MCX4094219.1 hypothetical protein [Nocardia sp. alder85J]
MTGKIRALLVAVAAMVTAIGFAGTASASPDAPQYSYNWFQAPSGNISCMISDDTDVRCDIQHYRFTAPPRPAGGCGPSGFGHAVSMSVTTAARFTCAGDTTMDPSLPVLPYGASTTVGQITCTSTTDYLSCSAGDHFLRLSQDDFALQ